MVEVLELPDSDSEEQKKELNAKQKAKLAEKQKQSAQSQKKAKRNSKSEDQPQKSAASISANDKGESAKKNCVMPEVKKVESPPKKDDSKKAEPKKAEPKKAEPKKAEPKKAEPKKTDTKKAEPQKAESKATAPLPTDDDDDSDLPPLVPVTVNTPVENEFHTKRKEAEKAVGKAKKPNLASIDEKVGSAEKEESRIKAELAEAAQTSKTQAESPTQASKSTSFADAVKRDGKGQASKEMPKKEQPKTEPKNNQTTSDSKKDEAKKEPQKAEPKKGESKQQPNADSKKQESKQTAKSNTIKETPKQQPKAEVKADQSKPESKKEQPKAESEKEQSKAESKKAETTPKSPESPKKSTESPTKSGGRKKKKSESKGDTKREQKKSESSETVKKESATPQQEPSTTDVKPTAPEKKHNPESDEPNEDEVQLPVKEPVLMKDLLPPSQPTNDDDLPPLVEKEPGLSKIVTDPEEPLCFTVDGDIKEFGDNSPADKKKKMVIPTVKPQPVAKPKPEQPKAKAKPETKPIDANAERPKSLTFYPFAYAILDDELDHFCWYCLQGGDSGVKLHRCSACKLAWFCSKTCQKNGWIDHRPECHGLDYRLNVMQLKRPQLIPNIEVRLLGRIAYRYKQIAEGKDKKADNFYLNRTSERNIMQIWSHDKDIRNDKFAREKYDEIKEGLLAFYPPKALPDEDTIFQLHCRNYINRHAISDRDYLREIGKGLYLDLCAYDHSCRPNTIYTCNGFIATLKPLSNSVNLLDKANTFYSYIDLLNSKQQRQKLLKDTWYFDCACDRCKDEDEHILSSIKCQHCDQPVILFGIHAKRDPVRNAFVCGHCGGPQDADRVQLAVSEMRYIDILVNNDQIDKNEKPLDFAKELLERYKPLLSPVNVYLARILQAAIRHAGQQDLNDMLQWHIEATDCLRICYPYNHPALSYHLMNIGVLANKCGQLVWAERNLEEALQMVTYCLGSEAHITKMIAKTLEDVKKAQDENEPLMD